MHLCTGQHTNIVELRALCQHEAALYMVMVRSSAAEVAKHACERACRSCHDCPCKAWLDISPSGSDRCWHSCCIDLGRNDPALRRSQRYWVVIRCAAVLQEFFPRGTMEVMLHHTAANRWDTAKLLLIIRSIASGVQYLHTRSPPILHRDIKPGNLFVGVNQARCSIVATP
jgi:serine/threonine protein kinase